MCLGVSCIVLLLLIFIPAFLFSQTSILHNKMRRAMMRDFSINKTLPNGADWDLSNPSIYDISSSRNITNLRIPLGDDSEEPFIGAWYMEPTSRDTSRPAVLYLHGIAQTRGYKHRVGLYSVLLKAGHPVLAIDYRGFGDSTELEAITETTTVEDAARALDYLRNTLGHPSVLVWGHSNGAATSASMMARMAREKNSTGLKLVLESPYSSMQDQINEILPWYTRLLFQLVGLDNLDMQFLTLENLPKTSCPVLIIHAEDDLKVPTKLSKKLFEETLKVKGDISRILMEKSLGFESSHNDIYTVGEPLAEIVAKFWEGEVDTEGETVSCTSVNIDSTCDL